MKDEYNFLHILNETEENDTIDIDFYNYQCDYYDIKELHKIKLTLTQKMFSVFHTNISSLKANFDNLHTLLAQMPMTFDIISLTEVWNNIDLNNNFYPKDIEGYNIYNGIPGKTKNSGSGFYIKNNIDFIDRPDLDKHDKNNNNEFTAKWIEIQNKKDSNILVASIYRHPHYNDTLFYEYLNFIMSIIHKENKLIIITGDFNYNLLKCNVNEEISNFLNCMYTNLLQPYIIYPTRFVGNAKPSLIDNIFSNAINREIISGNIIDKISDHMPNFIIIQDYKKSELREKYYKRDYSKFDQDKFNNDLQQDNTLQSIIEGDDVNSSYNSFHAHLQNTIDKHAPIKSLSKKETELKINPW